MLEESSAGGISSANGTLAEVNVDEGAIVGRTTTDGGFPGFATGGCFPLRWITEVMCGAAVGKTFARAREGIPGRRPAGGVCEDVEKTTYALAVGFLGASNVFAKLLPGAQTWGAPGTNCGF